MSETNMSEAQGADTEEIRRKIEETRAELGETVEALAAKADVKARVKEKQHELAEKIGEVRENFTSVAPEKGRDTFRSAAEGVRNRPLPAVFLAGLLVGWMVGRRK